MKRILCLVCTAAALSLAFTSCNKDGGDGGEKTALEGKWVHAEDYRVESFTFKGNTFALESSETGDDWGFGHKLTGTFTCTESSFTVKVEKFYAFNNEDKQFDWHEYEEGSVGQSFTFSYKIEDGHSLGVTPPRNYSMGGGSFIGLGEEVWYAKE